MASSLHDPTAATNIAINEANDAVTGNDEKTEQEQADYNTDDDEKINGGVTLSLSNRTISDRGATKLVQTYRSNRGFYLKC